MNLIVDELSARYGENGWELGPLSVEIPDGTVTGLVGPNGAGKSSLFKTLVGDIPPRKGTARVGGDDLLSLPYRERARRLAYLEQSPGMAFNFRVREVVRMAQYADSDPDPDSIEWALQQVGLDDCADRDIHALSGGQRRRVFLARALAQEPQVLLLDEPTSSLDVKFTWQLSEILSRARRRFDNLTVLWAQHDLEQASRVSDQMILMDEGRIHAGPDRPNRVLTRKNLQDVYDVQADVRPDPEKGGVRIVPAQGRNRRKFHSL
jgi:iron complex transport system ATP-binding protein